MFKLRDIQYSYIHKATDSWGLELTVFCSHYYKEITGTLES